MDLGNLFNIKQCQAVKFSYAGNEILQKICYEKLQKFFEQNIALWKRLICFLRSTVLSPTFLLRCSWQNKADVTNTASSDDKPFADILINYKSNASKTWEEAALLHFFFLSPTTVEEYRNDYRIEISEWFATVTKIEGAEWLIVFDSTEAREKKNRGAIIERIKSDFAKFTNRIIEIYESANISSLQTAVQAHLLNALEDYVTFEENSLSRRNDKYSDQDFDFITFCRQQMSLSRLYQTLGVYEQVLALFDELDAMLSLIALHHSPETPVPKWLNSSESIMGATSGCPLFVAMLKCDSLWENITVIEMRYIILAHQILISLRIYEERLERISTSGGDAALQNLKTEFAVTLLRYSQHCLNAVYECMATFKMPMNCDEMQCWIIAFCLEVLQLTTLLTEMTHIEQAARFICFLKLATCQAMSKLNERWYSVDWKKLVNWFDSGITRCGEEIFQTNAINEIRQLLSDQQQFAHYMQKYHESSIALLKHFGWRREARAVGWELAKFLLSSDRAEGALPYLLNFVSDLITDGSPVLLLRETLLFTVNHLEKFPGIHQRELIDFYLLLIKLSTAEDEQIKYCEKLLELSEKSNIPKIRLDSHNKRCEICTFGFSTFFPMFTATPDELVKINVKIINHLPKSLKNFKLQCYMKMYIRNGLQKPVAGRRPQFECIYSETDGINRFACIWKGDISVRRESIQGFSAGSIRDSQSIVIFQNSTEDVLKPGENNLVLTAKVSEVGMYLFEFFELQIGRAMLLHCDWVDVPEIELNLSRRPVCFIQRRPVSVKLKHSSDDKLIAGVAQHIKLEISSGSSSINDEQSVLQLTCPVPGDLEFWDNSTAKWSHTCNYSFGHISTGDNKTITVYVCKNLRHLFNAADDDDESRNGPVCYVEQVVVKWGNAEWRFRVNFISFMNIENRVSILEERVLFELAISRSIDDWLIIPQEAVLTKVNNDNLPQIPAKMLNPKLTNIYPGSKCRLVWILPVNKGKLDEIEKYELHFTYYVKSLNGHLTDCGLIYKREYMLTDEFLIPNRTPSYELCAQVLSSQPGAVLCRVDNACDMIVSLRSLTNRVETVIVSISADPVFWIINERHKLLYVKESGLGQTSFTVIPKMVGFLPYPSIAVYGCGHESYNSDTTHSPGEVNSDFGPLLSSFVRTNGKQVHVLGAFATSADSKNVREKMSRLKEAKSRLTKLF